MSFWMMVFGLYMGIGLLVVWAIFAGGNDPAERDDETDTDFDAGMRRWEQGVDYENLR
jgi:hypothetical protein